MEVCGRFELNKAVLIPKESHIVAVLIKNLLYTKETKENKCWGKYAFNLKWTSCIGIATGITLFFKHYVE